MKKLSSNLRKGEKNGRKIPLPVEITKALSQAKRSNGGKIQNAERLALFLQQIQYWLDEAEENRRTGNKSGVRGRMKDGRLWFYNSIGSWQRTNFPFWSDRTVRRLRDELVALGLVETETTGENGSQVVWYTLNYDAIDALATGEDESPQEDDTLDMLSGGAYDNLVEEGGKSSEVATDDLTEDHGVVPESTSKTTNKDNSGVGTPRPAPSGRSSSSGEGERAAPIRRTRRTPEEAEDTKIIPESNLGKAILLLTGSRSLTARQNRMIEDEVTVPAGENGRLVRVVPTELYDTDPYFQEWVPYVADQIKNKYVGQRYKNPSRDAMVSAVSKGYTIGKGRNKTHFWLGEFYKWREVRHAEEMMRRQANAPYTNQDEVDAWLSSWSNDTEEEETDE